MVRRLRDNERWERVESPGAHVIERISRAIFAWHRVISDRPSLLWWLSHGEGRDALRDAVGINCKMGATTENQGSGVKYMWKGMYFVIWLNMADYPILVERERHGIWLYVLEHSFTALCLEILSPFSMREKNKFDHRVESVIESLLGSKIMHLIYLRWNVCEITNDNKAIPENLVVVH